MKVLVLTAGLLMATIGCARTTRVAKTERLFCPKSTVTLYVQNDNWMDVVVFAVRGGSRFRLGQVSSIQSAVFEVPSGAFGGSSDLQFYADPIGAVDQVVQTSGGYTRVLPGFLTDNIAIAPGHTIVELRIDNIISHSSWSVGVEDPENG